MHRKFEDLSAKTSRVTRKINLSKIQGQGKSKVTDAYNHYLMQGMLRWLFCTHKYEVSVINSS